MILKFNVTLICSSKALKLIVVNRRESVFRLKPNQSFKIITQMQLQIGWKFFKILTLVVFYLYPVIKPAFILLILLSISQFRVSVKYKMMMQKNYLTLVLKSLDRPLHSCSFYSGRFTLNQIRWLYKGGFSLLVPFIFPLQHSFKNHASIST